MANDWRAGDSLTSTSVGLYPVQEVPLLLRRDEDEFPVIAKRHPDSPPSHEARRCTPVERREPNLRLLIVLGGEGYFLSIRRESVARDGKARQ